MSSKRINVLLLERVPDLGDSGAVVSVSEGYARNFLFPRGLAATATEGQLREVEGRRKKQEEDAQQELEAVERDVQQIDGITLVLPIKVGPEGKAHGAITTAEIADAIEKSTGVRIQKGKVRLDQSIREPGENTLQVEFSHGLEAEITVDVQPEEDTQNAETKK